MTSKTPTSPEVDQQYVIETLLEENRSLNDNRLYLMALLKQLQAEYNEAKAVWDAEKKSLLGATTAEG